MSVHSQRGKAKPMSRPRNQRMSNNTMGFSKPPYSNAQANHDDSIGLFSNTELNNVLVRHVIGNIGEVTTVENDKVLGVIKAVSPSGDMGLTYTYAPLKSKNGHVNANTLMISVSDWKMVRITNVRLSDCLMGDLKTDSEVANACEVTGAPVNKELIPFFEASDTVKDCFLDQGGFPAEEMFKTNKELFSVSTTYNPDLKEYTTPVDKSAANYAELEARCSKIAKEVEGDMKHELHPSDDEETAFSAVARLPKKQPTHSKHAQEERPSIDLNGVNKLIRVPADSKSSGDVRPTAVVCATLPDKLPPNVPLNKPAAITTISKAVPSVVTENSTPPELVPEKSKTTLPSDATSITEDKVKKSTLNPDAPEFHPRGIQYVPTAVTPQTALQAVASGPALGGPHAPPVVVSNHSCPMPMHSVPPFVQTQHPQLYVSSSMPYAPHSAHVPHLLPNGISAAVNSNIAQHMRGGSLPPSLHQQNFLTTLTPGPGFLMQHGQQPGFSVPQIINSQPSLVAAPNPAARFCPPSSMSLARQRSSESSTVVSHSTAYGHPQQNVVASTFQPPMYQLSQPSAGIPSWLSGHPQMGLQGLQFIPGAGGSPAMMMDNVPQTTGQPMYPCRLVFHMPNVQVDQTPSTTHQQTQQQQLFQAHTGHFQEHPQIQLPPYAPNMFGSQQPNPSNYYPTPPAVLTNANAVNQHMQSGLLPLVNQPGAHNTVLGNVAHHQSASLDQSLMNQQLPTSQFLQQNCHPSLLHHYNVQQAQLLQNQQLAASQHLNPQSLQPGAYHTLAAMVPSSGNQSVQPH